MKYHGTLFVCTKKAGFVLDTMFMQGNTALHYAVSHGNFDVVSLLLDTDVVNVDQCNRAGYTAVMLASLADVQTDVQRDVVLRLFQSGNVNLQASQVHVYLFVKVKVK